MSAGRAVLALSLTLAAAPVRAQVPGLPAGSPLTGSVPTAPATTAPVTLSLAGAIDLALAHNLALANAGDREARADADRWESLKPLLPLVEAHSSITRQTTNLAAFGFDTTLFPGVPSIVGPFNVFDARVGASQTLFDLKALNDLRHDRHMIAAAKLDTADTRGLVTLVVTELYLQAGAGAKRITTAREAVTTAQALLDLATTLRDAGTTTGIDVVRARVQLQAQTQRLIAAEHEFARAQLRLARAVGLRTAQPITLTDLDITLPVAAPSLDAALATAVNARADYRAALERIRAAEAGRQAARAERLPTVGVRADVGALGSSAGDARRTYTMLGAVRVPLFDAAQKGHAIDAAVDLRERQTEAADLAERIEADVRAAFLDVQGTGDEVEVARERTALARQELELARTRFAAGVTTNIEVIQAQDTVASATDNEIASVHAFNVAKATLTRTLGTASPGSPTR